MILTMNASDAIVKGLQAGITFVVICWIIGIIVLIGIVALITWVVKKIWFWGRDKENKPYKKRNPKRYTYGETEVQRNWREHYENIEEEPKWYPTGWVFNEKTKLWEPPDYVSKESERKWKWDDEKKVWIDQDKAERMRKYQEFHKDKEPTYEEWKAAREAERQSDTESSQ